MKLSAMLLAIVGAFALVSAASHAATVPGVTGELMCTCGCSMVVKDCNCGTADEIRALVQEKIGAGMDQPQILAYFVGQYGQTVLASPPKRGFDLTAWVLPFVVLLASVGVVVYLVRTWVSASSRGPKSGPKNSGAPWNAADRKRLSRELDRFNQ